MKYLRGRLIVAKHILLSIAAFGHRLKLIASIFTYSLTLILSRFLSRKYNLILSYFCKTEIPMKFAINGKYYTYVTIAKR